MHSWYLYSRSEYSLFTKSSCAYFTVILVYVYDMVLGGTDIDDITNINTLLNDKFSIKDLGSLKYFLDFEVARSKEGIPVCQRKYTLYIIQDTYLIRVNPCTTPMQPHL